MFRYVVTAGVNPYIPDAVVFYLLRYKDGTLEVLDCHGLLRKLIHRCGRYMEFRHLGIRNPKTRRRVLSDIFDTAGRHYVVQQELQDGSAVPRIVSIAVTAGGGRPETVHKKKVLRQAVSM
jgi:hypothetical protein